MKRAGWGSPNSIHVTGPPPRPSPFQGQGYRIWRNRAAEVPSPRAAGRGCPSEARAGEGLIVKGFALSRLALCARHPLPLRGRGDAVAPPCTTCDSPAFRGRERTEIAARPLDQPPLLGAAEEFLGPHCVVALAHDTLHQVRRRQVFQIVWRDAVAQRLQRLVRCLHGRHERRMRLQADADIAGAEIIEIVQLGARAAENQRQLHAPPKSHRAARASASRRRTARRRRPPRRPWRARSHPRCR